MATPSGATERMTRRPGACICLPGLARRAAAADALRPPGSAVLSSLGQSDSCSLWRKTGVAKAATQRWPDHGWRRDRFAYERGRLQLASVEITAHGVAVEACALELAHNHADVLLAEVLSPVPRNRDHNARFVAEAPMARCLAAEFGKAVID